MSGQRGFALLTVLWVMGLLSLLVGQFAAAGRNEVRIAANLRAEAAAEALADGAVHEAILHLLQGAWVPDGQVHILQADGGGAFVEVRVHNQGQRLNPNTAPQEAIQALLTRLGAEGKAETLARAIVEWRSRAQRSQSGAAVAAAYRAASLPYGPTNRPFDSLDELGLVVGMTPALLEASRPFLSVYGEGEPGQGEPGEDDLPDKVAPAWVLGATGRTMLALIEASASGPANGRFLRQAVVRLRADAGLDQAPYQILTWDTVGDR